MRNWLRIVLGLLGLLALLLMAACSGAPGCPQNTFGGSACTGGGGSGGFSGGGGTGGGGGGGGGNNPTPTGFVYAVDEGATSQSANGTIDGYDLSTSAGSFTSLSGYTAPAIPASEFGEGMVVVNKQFVYAVFELQQQLFGWSIDASTGALTPLAGFPMTVTLNLPIVNFNTYQIISDPAGNYLFLSSTYANEIFVFTIDSSTGVLTMAQGAPFSTQHQLSRETSATDGLGTVSLCVHRFSSTGDRRVCRLHDREHGRVDADPGKSVRRQRVGVARRCQRKVSGRDERNSLIVHGLR